MGVEKWETYIRPERPRREEVSDEGNRDCQLLRFWLLSFSANNRTTSRPLIFLILMRPETGALQREAQASDSRPLGLLPTGISSMLEEC